MIHFFWLLNNIPLKRNTIFCLLFISWSTFGLFLLWAIMNNVALNICVDANIGIIPRKKLLDYMVTMCNHLRNNQIVFQNCCIILHSAPGVWEVQLLQILTFITTCLYYLSHPDDVNWYTVDLRFLWWLTTLNTFSWPYWPPVYFLQRYVYSLLCQFFWLGCLFALRQVSG